MEDNKEKKKHTDNWAVVLWWHQMLEKYMAGKLSGNQKKLIDDWDFPYIRLTPVEEEAAKLIVKKAKREIDKVLVIGQDNLSVAKTKKRAPWLFPLNKYVAAAAIMLIVATATTFVLLEKGFDKHWSGNIQIAQTYFTTSDRIRERVTLPDGSTVLLNGGTTLRIRKAEYDQTRREVWLDEGEAFFEVAKNPKKPFIVHTPRLATEVKGTSFNVKAYPDLPTVEVSVRTGRVEISTDQKTIGILVPGRQLVYYKATSQHIESDVPPHDIAAWCEGRLVFRNAGVEELSLRMKQTYGVQLVVAGNSMDGKHISASFAEGTSLVNLMETISLLHGLHYTIQGNQVIIH